MEPPDLKIAKNWIKELHSLFAQTDLKDRFFFLRQFILRGKHQDRISSPTTLKTQLRIAVLVSRDLERGAPYITTQNLCSRHPTKCLQALEALRFGISETILIYDIATKVRECVNRPDERVVGRFWKVVLKR